MKSQTTIANSLSRLIVSLLLTCPTIIEYSHDTHHSAYALALPTNLPADEYARNGLPSLRQGLGVGVSKAKASLFERHGDDHEHSTGQEEEPEKGRVMDMFDVDLMANENEVEVEEETSELLEPLTTAEHEHVDLYEPPLAEHDTVEMPTAEHMHPDHVPNGTTPPAGTPPPHSGHVHHGASWVPLTEFNETDVLIKHGATPLSFLYHDLVLTTAQTIEFRRTGVSPYGNATSEMSSLDAESLTAWQEAQYETGVGSREEDRVMSGDGHPHPGLMALHVLAFSLAYFAVLPILLAIRAAKLDSSSSSCVAYGLGKLVFAGLLLVGWIAGVWYKSATPDLYVGHKHNIAGNVLLVGTLAVGAIDVLAMGRRLYRFAQSERKTWNAFLAIVVYDHHDLTDGMREYEQVAIAHQMELDDDDDDEDAPNFRPDSFVGNSHNHHKRGSSVIFTSDWANRYRSTTTTTTDDDVHHHQAENDSRNSTSSDTSTLRDSPVLTSSSPHELEKTATMFPSRGMSGSSSTSGQLRNNARRVSADEVRDDDDDDDEEETRFPHPHLHPDPVSPSGKRTLGHRAGVYAMHFFSRGLVVCAYTVGITGLVVYTGMGRSGYLPSLLAHLIKGSIFFWYGLLTFGRYLGAFAEYGWAWNARPAAARHRHSRLPSAEMIESFVIFFYGITNTWMERFGARPGDPYTIKQVQHISIAVMFWFGGLSGMGLESRVVRRLLGRSVVPVGKGRKGEVVQPKSYSFSFNPFPALVIGILGIAMSAHKQDYVFQVTIHALWGYCLAGFSLFRLLTYFFLWTCPPTDSILPSRPPTEALAAFCLACGGVLFFLSDEEIAYAAMRHAYDDGFAFLCWTVALVCFIFTWILTILAIKGWAVERRSKREMLM